MPVDYAYEGSKDNEKKHRELGKEMARKLLEESTDSLNLRFAVGEFLLALYKAQPDPDCGQQLLDWGMEQFWGSEVKKHKPDFLEIHKQITD